MTRPYVLDVSGYQPQAKYYNFWQNWKSRGVHGAIVKLSESTYYRNPYGAGQIAAAQHEGMQVSGYHFSRFRGNSQLAVNEANYAITTANSMGLPHGSVLVLDYEEKLGYRSSNTQAAIAFLNTVKNAGFTPVFYSYSGMAGLWDFEEIHRQTGAMLWIAAYPVMSGVTEPYMNYFPGISDHIGAWQFTDNFYGEHIDASVDLTGVFTQMTQQKITSGGHLDGVQINGDKLAISGWYGTDRAQGKSNTYMILTDENGKEYTRAKVALTARPDVAKAFPDIPNGANTGFNATFDYTPAMAGHKIHVIFRYTDDPAGNGNFTDFTSIVDLTKSAACLDSIATIIYSNKLRASGWFATDMATGLSNRYMILWDVDAKKELQRVPVKAIKRDDVKEAHPDIYGADQSGFAGEFSYGPELVGRKLQVIARYSDDPKDGEGKRVDYWFDPFSGPTMPAMDGKTTTEVICHDFSAEQITGGLIKLTMK